MGYIRLSKMKELMWNVSSMEGYDAIGNDYLINSQIDAVAEQELVLSRIDFNYHKNFIIFGLRNIELIIEIWKKKTPFSTMVIIEITDQDVKDIYLDGEVDQLEFLEDPRVNLIIGPESMLGRQLDIAFDDMLKIYNLRNLEIISMPYVKSVYPEELNSVIDTIIKKFQTSINSFGNDVEDILIGMDNYVNNWDHVFRALDCKYFENEYKGKPAIIVGAGPSLDKNINYLKNAKGKALILSVDGAMGTLLEKNIIPDIVASIERVEFTTRFYVGKEIPEDIIYVGPNVVMGSVLEKFKRIIFTGRKGDGLFQKFNNSLGFTNLNVGINVSHVLISFARYLGCSPIIFTGLDLAYTNGKTHTEKFFDNFEPNFIDNYKRDIVYLKGQNGENLETCENFLHTKSWIESTIAGDKDRVYINATEGGAKIDGALNLRLAEAISCYCDEEVGSIKDLFDKTKDNNNLDKYDMTNKALTYFTVLTEYFEKIIKESQKYYDKLFGSKKTNRVELMEKQRMSMDAMLSEDLGGRFILQPVTINYHSKIHSFPMNLEKKDEESMCEENLKYYKTIKSVSKKVIESIDAYQKVLKTYLNENNTEMEQ